MSKFFSLAYLTLPNTHPVDQIEIAAQCGYEGVGLRTISQHLPGEPDYALANGRMFQMVRAALERTGVRLMDIELARVADGVDVMSYEKEFALGAELGAKYAIASVWSADRDFSRVQFEKMCDLADKYGMKLNLEFVPFSNIPGLTEALAWMDLMDRPNVQVLVDTLHAHRVKVTPEQLREVAAGGDSASSTCATVRPSSRRWTTRTWWAWPGAGGCTWGRGRHRPGGDAEEHP